MPKASVTIFINTDSPKLFIRAVHAICWAFGNKDLEYTNSPYSITSDIEGE